MKNPFSIVFGRNTDNMIHRVEDIDVIVDDFLDGDDSCPVYMLTGLRGSGKTVAMTDMADKFRKSDEWIVVDLNPDRDLLLSLAAELSNSLVIQEAKLNLSFLGLGIEIKGQPPITEVTVALDKMLDKISKNNKRVLITVDEINNNKNVREFASQFQIFLRKNYPVFLIMTGLYENISKVQNEKTLTFLHRAPKIKLGFLNLGLVAEKYKELLNVDEITAQKMAAITNGYPYAYQVLGYLCWKNNCNYQEVMDEYNAYLEEYVYKVIWNELSENDKKSLTAIAKTDSTQVKDIRNQSGISSSSFNKYRERLIAKGLIIQCGHGNVKFTLPGFREFINRLSMFSLIL